ncbi:retrovirus-related pol polyprotein from transposon TNT 1-94 [Tanacetum coccineum]
MFDELLTPPLSVDLPAPEVIAPIDEVVALVPAVSIRSPSSTTVDQDAPSLIAHMGNDPYFGIPITEIPSNQSSSSNSIHTILHEQTLFCYYDAFLTVVEPKTYKDALTESYWIEAIQEELNEFECLEVWELVPRPDKVMIITLKWIYKVKLDELGGILKNKVYVSQPDSFVDPDNPNHVYKLKKVLYGLKQAPRAWYDMLSSFLTYQDFYKGLVDPTLFIYKEGKELLMVQVYVDDIIFTASTPELLDTPMVEKSKLDEDKEGKAVDPSHYRGIIGTHLYLTTSRPDLQFAICMCARYQARPTEKQLLTVKRNFRYLKGIVNRGLCYLKDSLIALTTFANANHAGCQDTRHSTSGSMQFLGDRLVSWSSKRFHFIKEQVENGVIELCFVNTEYQLMDIFIKALARERIKFLINKLGMQSFTPETLKQLADENHEHDQRTTTSLDNALVPREQHLTIGSCNYRLSTTFKPKEPTFQVELDELWAIVTYQKQYIRFKMCKKSYSFDMETFINILLICPKLPGLKFVDPPFEEEILTFIRELGYPGNIKLLSDVKVDTSPQPWRTFGTIINKCLSGKVIGIDILRLSRA